MIPPLPLGNRVFSVKVVIYSVRGVIGQPVLIAFPCVKYLRNPSSSGLASCCSRINTLIIPVQTETLYGQTEHETVLLALFA